jgi:hypothetical protein
VKRIHRMPAFALTIFTGAFLLFQVQPLIGKYILPWFGGGPGVWTTCMLFFQALLLGGYTYAHVLSRFKPRVQVVVHLVLVAVSLALLPIIPSDTWKPRGGDDPIVHILVLLTATLGLPYFVLSSIARDSLTVRPSRLNRSNCRANRLEDYDLPARTRGAFCGIVERMNIRTPIPAFWGTGMTYRNHDCHP